MFPTKTSGDDSEVITIIGRKEKVEAAKKHIEEMIKDLENITEDTISVDPKHHRHFIQRRGQVRSSYYLVIKLYWNTASANPPFVLYIVIIVYVEDADGTMSVCWLVCC